MDDTDLYIYGKNAVAETLKDPEQRIEKIFIRKNANKSNYSTILNLASTLTIPVSYVPGKKLYDLVGKVNDQGIVALISPVLYLELESWLQTLESVDNPAVLLLDEIEDPHNFGAIIRSAAAFGLHGIIIAKHRQAPVTAAVYKASAGTINAIPLIRVVNLNQTILRLKEEKFWIAGLSTEGEQNIWQQRMDMPLAFVIGNEGQGIRKKTLEHCDFHLKIPINEKKAESLNASVSAALVCYEWKRLQKSQRK